MKSWQANKPFPHIHLSGRDEIENHFQRRGIEARGKGNYHPHLRAGCNPHREEERARSIRAIAGVRTTPIAGNGSGGSDLRVGILDKLPCLTVKLHINFLVVGNQLGREVIHEGVNHLELVINGRFCEPALHEDFPFVVVRWCS